MKLWNKIKSLIVAPDCPQCCLSGEPQWGPCCEVCYETVDSVTVGMNVAEAHDFEKMREERNAAIKTMIEDEYKRRGWAMEDVRHTFDFNSCYCACASGGPCEHNFQGWRDHYHENGMVCGGETVCKRCGLGAMSHSLRIGM
jgi:hypothetical protein